VQTYRHDPADRASLADNVVRPILEDRRGRLWIGTFDGLDMLDRVRAASSATSATTRPTRPASVTTRCTTCWKTSGTIWVGTAAA
jgi:ligand-binding sensor domain-containing protein